MLISALVLGLASGASWALLAAPTVAAGPGTSVSLALSPQSIPADGVAKATATATVTDGSNQPVPGETVTFSSTDSAEKITSTVDQGNGTYKVAITSSTTVGAPTITATDTSSAGSPAGHATLTQVGVSVGVQLSPSSISADGSSFTTAKATVTDANNNPVPGDNVQFTSTDGGNQISTATDNHDGTYTATITSSTTVGAPTITATDTSVSPNAVGHTALTQTDPSTSMIVSLSRSSIPANGTSTATATATLDDGTTPINGAAVSFSSTDTGETIGPVTPEGNGKYAATIESSTTVGAPTIMATDQTTLVAGTAMLAQTDPATTVALKLSPSSIRADGKTTTTATATVLDGGTPIDGAAVSFSSTDPGEKIGAVTPKGSGKYSATIRSSTTVGTPIITATDTSSSSHPSDQRTLTQTDPATNVAVSLSPSSIVADGQSQSTVTATVLDGATPINGATVSFSSTDTNEGIGPTIPEGNGTYSATITSSTTVGNATITATDTSSASTPFGAAQLTQTNAASTTYLSTTPGSAVTNQPVTLSATVTSSSSAVALSGSVSFLNRGAPIAGCGRVPVSQSSPIATCQTSFSAAGSPESLTATFTASSGVSIAESTSAPASVVVGKAQSFVGRQLSSPSVYLGKSVTLTATVLTKESGPVTPSGSVQFMDGHSAIFGCGTVPLSTSGTARCTLYYAQAGSHSITAVYSGDQNFSSSTSSPPQSLTAQNAPPAILGTIDSTMEWSFYYTPSYTKVLRLSVLQAPIGANVMLLCHGNGCPFSRHSIRVTALESCSKGKRKCHVSRKFRTVDVAAPLKKTSLRVGARITVEIFRSHWIGKFYTFTIRSGQAPRVRIGCLAPGKTQPGAGC